MKICLICRQGRPVPGFTTVTLDHKEIKLSIRSVPAHVCSVCGETYVEQIIAIRLFQIAEKLEAAGLSGESVLYSAGD
jgi:YgiT-type zinc finger domain-containing protein